MTGHIIHKFESLKRSNTYASFWRGAFPSKAPFLFASLFADVTASPLCSFKQCNKISPPAGADGSETKNHLPNGRFPFREMMKLLHQTFGYSVDLFRCRRLHPMLDGARCSRMRSRVAGFHCGLWVDKVLLFVGVVRVGGGSLALFGILARGR